MKSWLRATRLRLLESIALQVYGDSSLWYLLADANGITDRYTHAGEKGSQLHIGQRLNIVQAANQRHTDKTNKVATIQDLIGNTSATTPLPPTPPPPQEQNSFLRILATIVVGIVTVIATVLSAGALMVAAGAMGLATGCNIST